jgi:hypothetical protein
LLFVASDSLSFAPTAAVQTDRHSIVEFVETLGVLAEFVQALGVLVLRRIVDEPRAS